MPINVMVQEIALKSDKTRQKEIERGGKTIITWRSQRRLWNG